MNRSIRWLPLFLALSTSSPFWNGSLGGLLSCRQARFDRWSCSGIPDFFRDEDDYRSFASRMRFAGTLTDDGQQGWAIRPAKNAAALELNIADTCTRVEDSVAIANLFRCHVAALVRDSKMDADRTTHTHRIAEENRWRAKCDGIDAQFASEESTSAVSARRLLACFLDSLDAEIAHFGCGPILTSLVDIANAGTSAHQQLRTYEAGRRNGGSHRGALDSVMETLTLKASGRETGRPPGTADALLGTKSRTGLIAAHAVGHC